MSEAIEKLRDHLHDEIDEKESLSDDARAVVRRVRERLTELVDEYGDTVKALEALAVLAEDELDGLTTEAVRKGFAAGKKRPV